MGNNDPCRFVNVKQTLDRTKLIDEAIFLAICGMNKLKDGDTITSPIRIEMAITKLQKVLDYINEEPNNVQ